MVCTYTCVCVCVCVMCVHTQGKAECKAALQEELRLPIEPDRPLLGFIGRLDYQKGPDLVLKSLEYLINLDCQVCICMWAHTHAHTPIHIHTDTDTCTHTGVWSTFSNLDCQARDVWTCCLHTQTDTHTHTHTQTHTDTQARARTGLESIETQKSV